VAGWLAKEATVAAPDFNRWLVPPAALAVHLSIGMAYGFSVFWLPLSTALGRTAPAPDDWTVATLGWMFTLFFVFLGSSAAVAGPWVEANGPRKAGVVAAACWSGGFVVSAVGIHLHQIGLLWLGSGVIGGCGLGLGYIAPVSTLVRWFPDRRGLATGLAIMGFGGGAMIGTPLATLLLARFTSPSSPGVAETFLVLGALYGAAMLAGAFAFRVPPPGWQPPGWTPPALQVTRSVRVGVAWRTPQFWLLWLVLCLNVTAGIGVLGVASPMIQEVFTGRVDAAAAAGFTGLLSLFNIAGRLFWSSLSDRLGRKATYTVFFALGAALYAAVPFAGRAGSVPLFVGAFCLILTMYGGGFATIPAYLADLFGPGHVGAIHGRLLTAWSTAGVLGPVLVNYLREWQKAHGVPASAVYDRTLWLMAALLVVGLGCNALVRPLPARVFEAGGPAEPAPPVVLATAPSARSWGLVLLAWAGVGVPLVWGVAKTVRLAAVMLGG
jgi:MFS family permease